MFNNIYLQALRERQGASPPMLQCHGKRDNLVLYEWGMMTHKKLTQCGVNTKFHFYPNLLHELGRDELKRVYEWISEVLPEERPSSSL